MTTTIFLKRVEIDKHGYLVPIEYSMDDLKEAYHAGVEPVKFEILTDITVGDRILVMKEDFLDSVISISKGYLNNDNQDMHLVVQRIIGVVNVYSNSFSGMSQDEARQVGAEWVNNLLKHFKLLRR